MRYLVELLTHPGEAIPAIGLASHGALADSPRHELLDETARADYERRAREHSAELAEAEANNDIGRGDKLRLEIDELTTSTAPGGRSRSFVDDAERVRTTVRKAIKWVIDAVAGTDITLAEQLDATVHTGAKCIYLPDVHHPVTWITHTPVLGD